MSAASALATRRSRQDSTAIRSTSEHSSSPTGLRSAISQVWKLSKSASFSSSTTSEAAVSPCHNELRAAAALPAAVLGPVLFCAFNRFAANCAGLVIIIAPLLNRSFIRFKRTTAKRPCSLLGALAGRLLLGQNRRGSR